MRHAIACALAIAATASQAQTIHRCQIGGSTVLQQAPCPGTGPAAAPEPRPAPPRPAQQRPPMGDPAYEVQRDADRRQALTEWRQQAGADLQRRHAAEQAQCPGGSNRAPTPGVSQQWVLDCSTWGQPSRKSSLTTVLGTAEQWHYSRGTLYFGEDRRLRTIITTR